jgi:hypothetical protein
MGVKLGSSTIREEHRLRAFENRVLRIVGPERNEVTGENCVRRSFLNCILHQI